ncbi:serum response factor-binding protein 1 [Plakobranchus ocellatus]|uniref:Serum response factor-binding protein 1 n=1 Tax=Plakobranchus ocellatus TaxID=259542 RepID=A0AAV4D1L2_9GAST|nr:serum response factor-binding protein 1 [Plakobranchus ocellatus]
MDLDSRSIDFAKTASIDLMSLNNKVINMRQVVKRTKVQVINKLCKNIAALKKKKGTEEQKAQNLRKAERLIDEIDSIKHLKEDKVTKYSLANTLSFKDMYKTNLSAGSRAMARLSDHPLMQKVVQEFRMQHSDWKDLTAYLLIKQTGRRFKTKKQKESKKLIRSVQNIHASETMTKAYIQERFGEDGLRKAEQRFEKKQKRSQLDTKSDSNVKEEVSGEPDSKKKRKDYEPGHDKVIKADKKILDAQDEDSEEDYDNKTGDDEPIGIKSKYKDNAIGTCHNETSKSLPPVQANAKSAKSKTTRIESFESQAEKMEEMESQCITSSQGIEQVKSKLIAEQSEEKQAAANDSETSSNDESDVTYKQEKTKKVKPKVPSTKSECVVKEFELDKSDYILSEEESSEDATTDEEEEKTNSGSDDSAQDEPTMSNRQKKKANIQIPSILTNKSQKPVFDPFFAGSDDEGEDESGFNDFDQALLHNPSEDEDGDHEGGSKSMFYNPDGDIYKKGVRVSSHSRSNWSNHRGGGRWQRQERQRDKRGGGSYLGSQRGTARSFGRSRGSKGSSRGGFNRDFENKTPRFNNSENPNAEQVKGISKSPPKSSEKLHPSWEASKKRKAEQSGIQAFKGKKITFDNDD